MECGKITADILLNCDNPIVGGAKDRMILLNYDDVTGMGKNLTNPQVIESIAKAVGTKGYLLVGRNNSIDIKSDIVKTKYFDGFNHEVVFRVFGSGPDVKLQIEKMAKGRFVAIIENNYKGATGEAAFEIYGMVLGLEVKALTTNKSDAETQGAYVITLGSPDDYKEPHLPATLFVTSYGATKTIFDNLLVTAV